MRQTLDSEFGLEDGAYDIDRPAPDRWRELVYQIH